MDGVTTFKNAEFSMQLLERDALLPNLSRMLLVSSEWHMRRCLLTVQRYFPARMSFTCCPTCEGIDRHNWTQSDEGRRTINHEAMLLRTFLQQGALRM